MLQQVIQQLSNYFLSPIGLAALAGIVPLIIFYLMRPSPEEKIMPSMEFFQQDKKSGRLQKALNILQRNLMLILHVLMIVGLAAAIANPYIMQDQRPQNAVIVIDNSASMKPVFEDVKQEAISNLGKQNTVIVANDDVEVRAEKSSFSNAKQVIENIEVEETGTQISRAIKETRDYDGKIFLASDMDQTGREQSVEALLESISSSRPLTVYNPEKSNSWGIVNLKTSENNATVYIQNFLDRSAEISLKVGSDNQELSLKSKELRKISFSIEDGKNTVKLQEDGFSSDNKAYLIQPSDKVTTVKLISDQKNRYLMKAFELMEGVNATWQKPSDSVGSADVYVVGSSDKLGEINSAKLSEEIKSGKGLVMFAQKDLKDLDIQDSPLNSVGSEFNTSVSIDEPISHQLGNITIYQSDFEGKSMSTPEEALKFAEYGQGKIFYYNLASQRFRNDIMYPVFWKQLLETASSKLSRESLNRRTGSTVLTDERTVELRKTGYREISGETYSASLLNGDESTFESVDKDRYKSATKVAKPESIREAPIVALMVLGLFELIYLKRAGEIP